MMPHIVEEFWIPSQYLETDLEVPLEILGFLYVKQLFKHVKQTLHGSKFWFFPRKFSLKNLRFHQLIGSEIR